MKLFILNKQVFEDSVLESKAVHIIAYHNLISNVACGVVPLEISADNLYGGIAFFDFKSKKGDVYFYNFRSVVYA